MIDEWTPAILLPALVVAQQRAQVPVAGVFAARNLLRASDIVGLRNALADAIARIDELERTSSAPLSKANVYESDPVSVLNPPGAVDSVSAGCRSSTDIILDCSCFGRSNAALAGNNTSMDLRQVRSTGNTAGTNGSCVCQGQNSGTNAEGRSLRSPHVSRFRNRDGNNRPASRIAEGH
jgi:hypothetical protein